MKTSAVAVAAIAITLSTFPADAQVQERTIRWGHLNNTDHPVSLGVQKFAEILAAKSGGKLKVREFPASQLGNEMQMQSALRGGTQDMMSAATTSLAGVVKEFGLLDFPFIVSSADCICISLPSCDAGNSRTLSLPPLLAARISANFCTPRLTGWSVLLR